ncbi:MAG: peptidase M50 [Methanomicrobiaceae archaeon]|nr:peptidase M50 [Methanomicrobiaceae archaeon]
MLERITERERRDLLIAWLAIAVAFTLIFVRDHIDPVGFTLFFAISLVTVGIGFVLHELAHKFTAMRYGYWAEFRKDNQMLLVAVLLAALVGVVFAAPGATMIYGAGMTREQNGRISAAGPISNLLLCVPFLGIVVLGAALSGMSGLLLSQVGIIGLTVNAMIAAFNMLPVSVLDGKKVLAWNPAIFGGLIMLAFTMLLLSFNYGGSLDAIVGLFL